jgi:iron complex transport system ATP-binding protein
VSKLDVSVPGRELVRRLDVNCASGEILAILGRNGAGKTLTLHTLAGLRDITQGDVSLNGTDIRALSRRAVAQTLALLPQDADDLFPASVYDTVLIGRHPHIEPLRLESAEDHDIGRRCLRELDLEGLADREVTTLSGGERRRLAIAQTLAQTPQTYLLDEPLNHLDPQHQLEVLDLFHAKARGGASVVATLHDVNLAMRYADRCLLLFGDGRWQIGDSREVLTAETLSALFNVRMQPVTWDGMTQFVAAGSR